MRPGRYGYFSTKAEAFKYLEITRGKRGPATVKYVKEWDVYRVDQK